MNISEREELINAALEDGVLTPKERAVLDRKAVKLGFDLDEFHIILEGRLQRRTREIEEARTSRKHSEKYGDIKRCPHCNAVVPAASFICVDCGYAFRNVGVLTSMQSLQEQLNRVSEKEGSSMLNSTIGAAFGLGAEGKQAKIIRDFPVPNGKEDLLEFMTVCKNRGNRMCKDQYGSVAGAYYIKYLECYEKAKIYFANDPMFQPLLHQAAKDKKKLPVWVWGLIGAAAFLILLWYGLSSRSWN